MILIVGDKLKILYLGLLQMYAFELLFEPQSNEFPHWWVLSTGPALPVLPEERAGNGKELLGKGKQHENPVLLRNGRHPLLQKQGKEHFLISNDLDFFSREKVLTFFCQKMFFKLFQMFSKVM